MMGVSQGLLGLHYNDYFRLSQSFALLHIVLWGIAMETNRENLILQWVNLAFCVALPFSAVAGIHAIPTVGQTYRYDQVMRAGMPCYLLLSGLLRWINNRSLFYLSIALGTVGLAASARNLVVIYRNRGHKIKPDRPA